MKKKIILILEIIFIVGEIAFIIMPKKELENNIEKVTYNKEEIKNSSMFAYMLDDGTGQYNEITDRNDWPDIDTHAYIRSECYDGEGIKQNTLDVFSFNEDTFTATMNTNTTLYCYLYFASIEDAVGLIVKKTSGQLESDEHMKGRTGDTLRRFQGQVTTSGATITNDVNNYICFGTDDEGICTRDTDKYMYRIIGIDTTNNEIKIIKREALNSDQGGTSNSGQAWGSSGQTWATSPLQEGLNGTLFLKAQSRYEYMQEGETETYWTKLISPHDWGYGDVPYNERSGFDASTISTQAYQNEQNAITSGSNHGTLSNTKIGLIYASDYWLSGGDSLRCHPSSNDYGKCTSGWMHLSNNDTSSLSSTHVDPPDQFDWTMSQATAVAAWLVHSSGFTNAGGYSAHLSVRPVFYLVSGLKLSGEGTLEHPYLIAGVPD